MNDSPSLRIFTTRGVQYLSGMTATERSVVASHWNAVRRFLEYGDDSALVDLERSLTDEPGHYTLTGGHLLEFDLDAIERVAFAGDVRFESIYEAQS